jgi:hypothetical protein
VFIVVITGFHRSFKIIAQFDWHRKPPVGNKFQIKTLETWQQSFHTLAASCVQSRQCFASTLPEQLFEVKKGRH